MAPNLLLLPGTTLTMTMDKPTPQTVREAHLAAFSGRLNMVACANHCHMTLREFKMTFWEYLKYNKPTFVSERHEQLRLDV